MPIMWSRIHAELGLSPSALTYDVVRSAVAANMAEADDLDWKQALPAAVEKKWWDFAKDIAAMANTRGGLIVFGVRDSEEKAVELVGVPNGQSERQTLTNYAARWVRPLIGEVVIEALDGRQGEPGLIVVFVPPSPDSPHVVGEKNEMGVPYRYGPHTSWMSESELERAYRDRFSRQADDRAALAALIDGLMPEVDSAAGVWLAIATRPVLSPPRTPRPDRQLAIDAISAAMTQAPEIVGNAYQRFSVLSQLLSEDTLYHGRTGLRRWTFRSNHYNADPHTLVDWAVVELHHDGCIALTVELTGFMRGATFADKVADVWPVPVKRMDSLLAEAVAIASAHLRSLGGTGTILARATLLATSVSRARPLVAVDASSASGRYMDLVSGSRSVRVPMAVEAAFAATGDCLELRDAARQLAEDLNHQFGNPRSSLPG
jgi:hypothetical protein